MAQQEVDDAQGKDLAAEAQVEGSKSHLQGAQSQLEVTQAKRAHDQALFDYSNITAPFAGVITQRYANLGALMQAGTSSSTQAMPLVRLSQDNVFRLVIPVPESYVRYIHAGDPVQVNVPSLNRTLPGKVARFSQDVKEDTRTMHTEVDVPNVNGLLVQGLYAEATITLETKNNVLYVPLQAVDHNGDQTTVFVVTSGNKIERRTVALGIQTSSDAEVISGLQEGDMVVVSDHGEGFRGTGFDKLHHDHLDLPELRQARTGQFICQLRLSRQNNVHQLGSRSLEIRQQPNRFQD